MKRLAGNEIMEFLKLSSTERDVRFMSHNLQLCDQRADWALRLLQSWGMAAAMGDIINKFDCEKHGKNEEIKPVPPQELMMRICEVVDAAWNEMQHRGWLIQVGSLADTD